MSQQVSITVSGERVEEDFWDIGNWDTPGRTWDGGVLFPPALQVTVSSVSIDVTNTGIAIQVS